MRIAVPLSVVFFALPACAGLAGLDSLEVNGEGAGVDAGGPSNDAGSSLALEIGKQHESEGGSDAGSFDADTSDAAPDGGGGTSSCRLITFEDALGSLADNAMSQASGSAVVDGVTFRSTAGQPVFNLGRLVGTNPFTSDWFALWTYAEGGSIDFPAKVEKVEFTIGQRDVETGAVIDIYHENGDLLTTVTASRLSPAHVRLSLSPALSKLVLKFESGSSSNLGIDDLWYGAAGCQMSP